MVERVLAAPFALDNPLSQRNRPLGLLAVLGWLRERPGEQAAKAAIARFATATSRAGLSAEPVTLSASAAGAGDQFARIARRFDLAIVGQAEPQGSTVEELIAETTLFESGGPLIIVPYIQKAPLKLDRVMVGHQVDDQRRRLDPHASDSRSSTASTSLSPRPDRPTTTTCPARKGSSGTGGDGRLFEPSTGGR